MINDFLLFGKIKDGDVKAFEKLFRTYFAPLCLFAAGITGRMEVAEDIVQDLFYTLWKERATMQIRSKSYLYGAVRNQSCQYLERQQVRERYESHVANEAEATAPDPQTELEYAELEATVERALAKLPERRSRIFHLHRMEGRKYGEIAAQLSLSVKTVEAEMTKAYRQLKQEIEKYYKDIS
jgi:RNA polymerase sigma-70 factor (ECF subfamily)